MHTVHCTGSMGYLQLPRARCQPLVSDLRSWTRRLSWLCPASLQALVLGMQWALDGQVVMGDEKVSRVSSKVPDWKQVLS